MKTDDPAMKRDRPEKQQENRTPSSQPARRLLTEVLLAGAVLDKDRQLERKMLRRKKERGW